jgi:hypothetical protein
MKTFIIILAIVLCFDFGASFLFKTNKNRDNNSKCIEKIQNVEDEQCRSSYSACRQCCHFDLNFINDRYSSDHKEYYIKGTGLSELTGECKCNFCKKDLENFDNVAYFRK